MSPVPRCRDCFQKAFGLVTGRCPDCYFDLINSVGELHLLVNELSVPGIEQYEYEDYDVVYATFFRLEDYEGFYVVKRDERKWCLKLDYMDGYPCAPRLSFVNALNHEDENPLWWPRTTFYIDPIRRMFDLEDIDDRCSTRLADTEKSAPVHRWIPNHYVALIAPKILP